MIVTFPHMGSLHVVLQTLFANLGLQVLVPPPVTKKTLELGTAYAPETACLPFKLNLGNFIEALGAGADTVVTCGGYGPCRIGYYAENQKKILRGLGYQAEFIAVEPDIGSVWRVLRRLAAGCGWRQIYRAFRLAGAKLMALDAIERQTCFARAREIEPGGADKLKTETIGLLAAINDPAKIDEAVRAFGEKLAALPADRRRQPVRIGLIGEIYVALEPFVNQELVRRIGGLGVEVHQPQLLGDYVKAHLLMNRSALKLGRVLQNLAAPYIGHYVGGHGAKNIGYAVKLGREGYDGFIHVFPFTCMPEVIAKNILPQVSSQAGIPGLSLSFDEQTGLAGVMTRVEAFIDLLRFRQDRSAGR